MSDYRKHRLEKRNYSHDFAAQLADGDGLTGTPTVKVTKWNTTDEVWEDKSSEFGTMDPTVSGTTVVWTLNAADADEQDAGQYRVLVECDTTEGEHLVAEVEHVRQHRRPILTVYEDGDPDAP